MSRTKTSRDSGNKFPDLQERLDHAVPWAKDHMEREMGRMIQKPEDLLLAASTALSAVARDLFRHGQASSGIEHHSLKYSDLAEQLRDLAEEYRGGEKAARGRRNAIIAETVRLVVFHYHLTLTRSRKDSGAISACDVVSRALGQMQISLSYIRVAAIEKAEHGRTELLGFHGYT